MRDLGRRWAIGALIVLAIFVAVLAAQTWAKATRPTDLQMYLAASRALWSGADPYAAGDGAPFIYPLFLCVVVWPLWHVPLAAHVWIWFALSIASAVVAISLLSRLHQDLGRHRLIVASAIVAMFLAEPMQSNLRNGQINFIVIAMCAAFAWYWSRGRGVAASAWLAAAISLKITPAIFIVFLVMRRQWSRIAESLAMTALFAIGLPWLVAGSRMWADYRGYLDAFLLDRATGAPPIEEMRPLSVSTFLHKYIGTVTSYDVPLLGLALVLFVALAIDRGVVRGRSQLAMLVSLYLATIVFAAPMTEAHHAAFLMPGLAFLVWRALAQELSLPRVAAVCAVLVAFAVMRRVPGAAFAGTAGTWVLLVMESRNGGTARGNSATPNGVFP